MRARPLLPSLLLLSAFASVAFVTNPRGSPRGTAGTLGDDPDSATPSTVRTIVSALQSDGPATRGAPSAGDRAARFIADRMKRIGLKPAGDSGFFQHVPLVVRNGHAAALPTVAALDSIPPGQRRMAVNVIGVIPGYRGFLDRVARRDAAPADSVVVVDAFFGRLGIDRPASDDSVDHGADVDASGAAAVLELARVIQGDEPHRYTIAFVVTTGDEEGQAGTTWYVAHPFASIGLTVASLGFEMIGRADSRAGGSGRAWITNDSRSTMGELFRHDKLPFVPDPRSCQQVFAPGDRAFGAAGIPAHTISSFDLPMNYRRAPNDSATLDFKHMAAVIDAGVHAVRMLADDSPPTWLPGGKPGMPDSKPDSLCASNGHGGGATVDRVRDRARADGR